MTSTANTQPEQHEDESRHRANGVRSAAISNFVVQMMSEYTGRGPTKARTYLNDDLITVILQDTLTKGERSLVRDGREDLVLSTRLAYQQTMRNDLVGGLEQVTGRKVRAFMSANHIEPDVAVETFLLDGDPADAPQRSLRAARQ